MTAAADSPAVSFDPPSVDFGDVLVGEQASRTVTVTNTGGSTMGIKGVGAQGPFLIRNNTCQGRLGVQQACHFDVIFDPVDAGPATGTASVFDDAPGSPHQVPLSGAGLQPAVLLAPTSVDFGNQNVGSSKTTVVMVSNTGTGPLHVTAANTSGPFSVVNETCTSQPVAPNGACNVFVSFSPTAVGAATGSLTLTDNAADSPQTVPLAGTGTQPMVSVAPNPITFPDQRVGGFVTTAAVVTNTGTGPLHVTATNTSAPFSVVNETCSAAPVAPNGTCTVFVRFTPTQRGVAFTSLTIADDAPDSPQKVPLAGRGIAPVVSVSPNPVIFGNVPVDGFGRVNVFITNNGDVDLHLTGFKASSPFEVDPNLGSCIVGEAIAPGDSCGLAVNFRPTSAGFHSGTLTITDDAPDSPQLVPLYATAGPTPEPAVIVSPNPIAFGDVTVGSRGRQNFTVANFGSADLSISDLTASAPFSVNPVLGSCPPVAPLPPGQSCVAELDFDPTIPGPATGTLAVTDNAPDSPQKVSLTGNGVGPAVSVSPASISYGDIRVGDFKADLLTVTNSGTGDLHVASMATAAPFSLDFDKCSGTTVAPGNSCDVFVRFTPTQAGPAAGSLSIVDDAPGSPQKVPLSGNGTAPAISITPNPVAFGDVPTGGVGKQSVIIRNTGTADLTLTNFGVSGPFAINAAGNACIFNSAIPPGGACSTEVDFSPTAVGPATGTLTVTDDAPGSPQQVPLTGNGVQRPIASISPPTVNFGDVVVGQVSPPATVTMTNTGNADLHVSAVDISGPGFAFGGNACGGAAVKPGDSCTIQVQFQPTNAGPATGNVTFTDDAPGTPQQVPLSGNGVKPLPTVTGLAPDQGPAAGGTQVTIQGDWFVPGETTVTIGGTVVPADQVAIVGDPTATFTTPPHAPGPVQVIVSTPAGAAAALTFTYLTSPPSPSVPAPSGPSVFTPGSPSRSALGGTTRTGLAFTGSNIALTVSLGLLLLAGGALALALSRRRIRRPTS